MNTSNPPGITTHPDSALLEYLEDLLPREDRAVVEEHLKTCAQCAQELEELDQITSLLRQEKEAFCPEPWQLYEFAQSGTDSTGRMIRHLERCSMCREEIEAFKGECAEETAMPAKLREAVRRNFSQDAIKSSREPRSIVSWLTEMISPLFRVPVMALGTAAAAVLLVVLIYPRGEFKPVVGLSNLTWDQPKEGVNLFGPRNGIQKQLIPPMPLGEKNLPKVATIIFFKGFDRPFSQEAVDRLYAAMQPTEDMSRRFHFLSPSLVKGAFDKLDKKQVDGGTIAKSLHSELKVSGVLMITVVSEGDKIGIEDELLDAGSGKTLGKTTLHGINENDLTAKIKEASLPLLEAKGAVAD